ncbi:hypothetical protein CL648_03015 [bacterium]|nr:hypothetical protein [bacterium]|tara:strand:- start:6150 stop:8171 length:2022 start_codon:yes stop_codon:yes gene_type:complete
MRKKAAVLTLSTIGFVALLFGITLLPIAGPLAPEPNADTHAFNPDIQYRLRCARCHEGTTASHSQSKGPIAPALLDGPSPIGNGDVTVLARIIANGIPPHMPGWKYKLTERDIYALATYIADRQNAPPKASNTATQLVPYTSHLMPNSTTTIGIQLHVPDGAHTYWKLPGDTGLGPTVHWETHPRIQTGDLLFPKPKRMQEGDFRVWGYDKTVQLLVPLTVGPITNTETTLTAHINWLLCTDVCTPQSQTLSLTLPVDTATAYQLQPLPTVHPNWTPPQSIGQRIAIPKPLIMLGLAIIGGMLLNLMPCVFPMLVIKAQHLIRHRTAPMRHAIAYTGGIVISMLVLASGIEIARLAGHQLGWGFQLQTPAVVMALLWLFFTMGLWLTFGISLTLRLPKRLPQSGLGGSVAYGILTTITATPCTAPFMGGAVGFSLTQPWPITGLIFIGLGIGLASPIVLLSAYPAWIQKIPTAGHWLRWVKPIASIPLYGTCLWLLWTLYYQGGLLWMALSAVGVLIILIAIFPKRYRLVSAILALLGLICIGIRDPQLLSKTPTKTSQWRPYSQALIQMLSTNKTPYFIDFTAKWCITCQANKVSTLNTKQITRWFDTHQIVRIRADWTNHDPQITQALAQWERAGVPTYVFYHPIYAPNTRVLPELLTPSIIRRLIPNMAE